MAASHPEVVAALARQHDAWFADVLAEWKQSRARIEADDRAAWQGRPAPDPAALFKDFWLWETAPAGTDPKSADPLTIFPGYWSASQFKQ